MSSRRFNVIVPAGGVVENALAGSAFERIGAVPQRVTIWATVPAAGLNEVTAVITYGPETVCESGLVPVERAVGLGPTADDIPLADDVGAPLDQLRCRLTNSDAGAANTVTFYVKQDNVG
jgi:hypothetical protein